MLRTNSNFFDFVDIVVSNHSILLPGCFVILELSLRKTQRKRDKKGFCDIFGRSFLQCPQVDCKIMDRDKQEAKGRLKDSLGGGRKGGGGG